MLLSLDIYGPRIMESQRIPRIRILEVFCHKYLCRLLLAMDRNHTYRVNIYKAGRCSVNNRDWYERPAGLLVIIKDVLISWFYEFSGASKATCPNRPQPPCSKLFSFKHLYVSTSREGIKLQ